MALDTHTGIAPYDAPEKDLYEIGEMPPLGYVPKQMYAWTIRRERHGEPESAMQQEVVDTWAIDSNEVLVLVMAAGVNYNGVWAALGQPIVGVRCAQGSPMPCWDRMRPGLSGRWATRSNAGRSATRS